MCIPVFCLLLPCHSPLLFSLVFFCYAFIPVSLSGFQPLSRRSSGASTSADPPKPLNPFDLLSGLISKTEASKSSSLSSPGQSGSETPTTDDDPMQMLAGLMKSVKPPKPGDTPASVPLTPSPAASAATAVKQEMQPQPQVKQEPASERTAASSQPSLSVPAFVSVKSEPQESSTQLRAIPSLGA